ncbi:MAG: energy-dependent translational throttle protein EttA [Planctomycetota bacterium]|nr:MAG: energy-dependent translational throttle protein EttA [Planctomycetota bacterium]
MGAAFIYQISDLNKKFGQRELLKNVNLAFYPGAKIGLLGRNGAGKSTLLKIMAGIDHEYEGESRLADGYTVGYLEQEPLLDPTKTVFENVMEAVAPTRSILTRFEAINARLGEPMEPAEMDKLLSEQAAVQDQIEARGAWDLDRQVEIAMDAMNLPPGDWQVTNLSGGERRRVALCKLLLERPDMLLLDEPTNHLDAESVNWLEKHLAEYPGTVVAVTHDRYFLDNVAKWILEVDHGRGIPFEGNYTSWLRQKKARMELEEKQASARQKTLDRELEWISMSPKARQAKSKARVSSYEKLAAEQAAIRDQDIDITIPASRPLGDLVIEGEGLSKGFGDKLLFENLSFRLPPGGIVGIIGPNGAGKTTLFRMLVGQEKPDSGTLRIGPTVDIGYVDQNRDALDPEKTVFEEISGGHDTIELGKRTINARSYVARFNFIGPDQQKKVGRLSGGERNRVHLAKLLRSGSNLLLLDEPTNDLDVDTLRSLEEGITSFAGSVVVITHDRWFLDRLATHIIAFEGDGYVHVCEGNFEAYETNRRERQGIGADEPHRFRYKKLQH